MSGHTDRLIEETLALVRSALHRDHIDFKEITGPVETNLFTSEQVDRYTSEVAVASLEMVTSGPAPSPIPPERPDPALPSEPHKGNKTSF